MLPPYILPIIGSLFLAFRVWLSGYKLKDELQFRRFYVSRLVSYYFCIAIIGNLQWQLFNTIVLTCFPAMIMTSVWDVGFYRGFKHRTYWEKNHAWLIVERVTMHPPVLITGAIMYLTGISNYVTAEAVWTFWCAIIIFYIPCFFLDIRLRKRYNWPNGRNLFIVMLISTVGFSFYYILG